MKNQAAFMTGVRQMEIRDIPMPVCGNDDVMTRSDYLGVCGSDAHFYEEGRIGATVVNPPFILGHEYSGTVIEAGKNVKNIKPGDRVALEPGIFCGRCHFCVTGRYNLCESLRFRSAPPVDGLLCRYIVHPAHLAFKLPDSVSSLNGALIEPLAVGLYSAVQGGVELGKTAAILGGGCIGLTTLLACKQRQASKIIISDLYDSRLERARALGADYVVNSSASGAVEAVMDITNGRGADVVFETAGSKHTALETAQIVSRGGRVVMVGIIVGDIPFNFRAMGRKEADLKTIWRYRNIYPAAIKAIEEGYINLDGIVSDVFAFEDAKKAFDSAVDDKEHVIKAAIKF
jgi:L-iditol 2-dehydrogenase